MKKKTLKTIGLSVLGAVVLIGGASLIANNYDKDLKTIHPTFHVGGLDKNGEYVDTDQSLYSEPFKCKGLEVKLDFDNDVNYFLSFYQSNGDYITRTEELDDDFNLYESSYYFANFGKITHARLVIIPQWTNVEIPEDKTEEDVKVVKWTNITSFANQLEIKVFKNQDIPFDVVTMSNRVTILKDSCIDPGGNIIDSEKNVNIIKFYFSCTLKYKVTYPKNFKVELLDNNYIAAGKTISVPDGEESLKQLYNVDVLNENSFIIDTVEYSDYGCTLYICYVDGYQPTIEIID